MGSLAKGFLRKVCGNSAESSRKLRFVAPGKGAESLRKFRGNLRKIFHNDPFPNDPISKLLRLVIWPIQVYKMENEDIRRCVPGLA